MIRTIDLDTEKSMKTFSEATKAFNLYSENATPSEEPKLVAEAVTDHRYAENRIKMHKDGVVNYRFAQKTKNCYYCGVPTYATEFISPFGYIGFDICPDCLRAIADKLDGCY